MAKKGIEVTCQNGDTLFYDQVSSKGDIMVSRWNGEQMIHERKIPALDMAALYSLYADIKKYDLYNQYLNPEGRNDE